VKDEIPAGLAGRSAGLCAALSGCRQTGDPRRPPRSATGQNLTDFTEWRGILTELVTLLKVYHCELPKKQTPSLNRKQMRQRLTALNTNN
jgi:type II secretory pathway component PulK